MERTKRRQSVEPSPFTMFERNLMEQNRLANKRVMAVVGIAGACMIAALLAIIESMGSMNSNIEAVFTVKDAPTRIERLK
ncbi:hypothetical protein [Pseudobacteriovorax antillogorgiicola]|nr:hypothetical protein [Pseudobacteriovorax antillogorgiicola]